MRGQLCPNCSWTFAYGSNLTRLSDAIRLELNTHVYLCRKHFTPEIVDALSTLGVSINPGRTDEEHLQGLEADEKQNREVPA